MKWRSISIHTNRDAEDILSSILCDLGFEGVEIRDSAQLSEEDKKKLFIDFLPEVDESDTSATVTCYLNYDKSAEEAVAAIREEMKAYEGLVDFGDFSVTVSETEEEDWVNNWKRYFHAFRIDDDIVIKPSWEKDGEFSDSDMVVEIDPGTAFGTGSHETTRLCILNLKKYLKPGDALLDVGCGSGILTIIGRKLGAGLCNAIDIDPVAVQVAKENTEINGLPLSGSEVPCRSGEGITYIEGDLISDSRLRASFGRHCYPVVVANILADIILPLSEVVGELLCPGGIFISSGIIDTREDEVRGKLEAEGFSIVEICRQKDWVSIVAKAPEA